MSKKKAKSSCFLLIQNGMHVVAELLVAWLGHKALMASTKIGTSEGALQFIEIEKCIEFRLRFLGSVLRNFGHQLSYQEADELGKRLWRNFFALVAGDLEHSPMLDEEGNVIILPTMKLPGKDNLLRNLDWRVCAEVYPFINSLVAFDSELDALSMRRFQPYEGRVSVRLFTMQILLRIIGLASQARAEREQTHMPEAEAVCGMFVQFLRTLGGSLGETDLFEALKFVNGAIGMFRYSSIVHGESEATFSLGDMEKEFEEIASRYPILKNLLMICSELEKLLDRLRKQEEEKSKGIFQTAGRVVRAAGSFLRLVPSTSPAKGVAVIREERSISTPQVSGLLPRK